MHVRQMELGCWSVLAEVLSYMYVTDETLPTTVLSCMRTCACSHLVICGGLTYETLKAIVNSFVYHDWTDTNVGMVVINRSATVRNILKCVQRDMWPTGLSFTSNKLLAEANVLVSIVNIGIHNILLNTSN